MGNPDKETNQTRSCVRYRWLVCGIGIILGTILIPVLLFFLGTGVFLNSRSDGWQDVQEARFLFAITALLALFSALSFVGAVAYARDKLWGWKVVAATLLGGSLILLFLRATYLR
jgi:hypothetical protein